MSAQRELVRRWMVTFIGAAILIFLWHRNYNLLGDTYDYSIVTWAAGYLHAGLKPYRDFTTPLQSLTIYLCYLAELIFGRRYLALGYMNLVIGLGFYAVLLCILRNFVPPMLGILAGAAICAATYFQHGVLWYNSLAISLLMLVVLCAAVMYRRQRVDGPVLFLLCLLLYLSSMCKMNYHIFALAFAVGILALLFLIAAPDQRKKFIWAGPAVFFFGVVLGPVTEVVVNGTTFNTFIYCVFTTPQHRLTRLMGFLDPTVLLGKTSDFLPDNWCSGVYLFALLIFCSCLYFLMRKRSQPADASQSGIRTRSVRYFAPFVMVASYFTAMVISMTNSDIEWLTSSFLMAGLLATLIMFAPAMSGEQALCLNLGTFLLTGFFFIGSGASAFMHSRVRPGEPGWTRMLVEAVYTEKKLSAWKNAVPFYDASQMSPDFSAYFGGVRFTKLTYPRLVRIADFVKKYDLKAQPQKVYWGSGLQIMNRVYNTVPAGRFPLWYHFKVTVRNEDAPALIDAFKKNDYEWIFCTHWIVEMPTDVRNYFTNNYQSVGDEDLIVFHKKP